jgi:adenylosuccinate lyase
MLSLVKACSMLEENGLPILPIDTRRYGTPEMLEIFEEENRLQRMLDVEAALAWAHAEVGDIPRKDAEKIVNTASVKHVKLSRVKEIEREIKHDVTSLVRALAEACGSSGAYVHLGATSSDILDTATALQLRDAINLLENRLNNLEKALLEKVGQHKRTIIIGRTHGQHALPITLGFKFAIWVKEIARHIQRLRECKERILVGKMSGAVGTQAGLGPNAMKIQQLVMEKLGIKPAEISTQIVQRDRHAELVCLLAITTSTLDKMATEIRELQRTEIGELIEPFKRAKQVGSSTMPHKRNPELCERVSGLAKVMRSLVIPALENIPTWHERDITQSSAERFIIPEACILTDYMLNLMTNIIENLQIDEKRMRKNIELTQGRIMSEAVMIALTRKGVSRQEAHEHLRRLAIKSEMEKQPFKRALLEDKTVRKMLNEKEINKALNPRNYLGTAIKQVELVIKKTRRERKARGLVD